MPHRFTLYEKKKKEVHLGFICCFFFNLFARGSVRCLNREYVYSAVVYQKYLTRLRELIIFEPWRENYHFSQPTIYDSTMYVFYLYFNV